MPPRRAGSKRTGGGGGGGGEGATERLLQQIKEGQGYEALQTARALFARQEGQGKSGQARTMALELAKAYAETGEYKSVLDLARLYMGNNTTQTKTSKQSNNSQPQVIEVSAAEASKLSSSSSSPPPPTDPTMTPHHFTTHGRDNMLSLAASLPAGSTEKIALLKGVSRWSLEETGRTLTDTHLGLALAGAYREAGDYGQAANKFTQMASLVEEEEEGGKGEMEKLAKMYAEVLKEWSLQGYVGEKDLFVARAVLQLVVRGGNATRKGPTLAYARALLNATLATADEEKDTQITDSPLLHYLSLLLDLIDTHLKTCPPTPTHTSPRSPILLPPTSELFRLLTSRYQPVLERDPSFPQATQKIGENYFNILPPQNPMQALLQSMMGGGAEGPGGLLGSMLGGGAGGGGGLLGALGGMGNLGL